MKRKLPWVVHFASAFTGRIILDNSPFNCYLFSCVYSYDSLWYHNEHGHDLKVKKFDNLNQIKNKKYAIN